MTLNKVVGMSEDLVGLQRHREFEYGIRFQPSFLDRDPTRLCNLIKFS